MCSTRTPLFACKARSLSRHLWDTESHRMIPSSPPLCGTRRLFKQAEHEFHIEFPTCLTKFHLVCPLYGRRPPPQVYGVHTVYCPPPTGPPCTTRGCPKGRGHWGECDFSGFGCRVRKPTHRVCSSTATPTKIKKKRPNETIPVAQHLTKTKAKRHPDFLCPYDVIPEDVEQTQAQLRALQEEEDDNRARAEKTFYETNRTVEVDGDVQRDKEYPEAEAGAILSHSSVSVWRDIIEAHDEHTPLARRMSIADEEVARVIDPQGMRHMHQNAVAACTKTNFFHASDSRSPCSTRCRRAAVLFCIRYAFAFRRHLFFLAVVRVWLPHVVGTHRQGRQWEACRVCVCVRKADLSWQATRGGSR